MKFSAAFLFCEFFFHCFLFPNKRKFRLLTILQLNFYYNNFFNDMIERLKFINYIQAFILVSKLYKIYLFRRLVFLFEAPIN